MSVSRMLIPFLEQKGQHEGQYAKLFLASHLPSFPIYS